MTTKKKEWPLEVGVTGKKIVTVTRKNGRLTEKEIERRQKMKAEIVDLMICAQQINKLWDPDIMKSGNEYSHKEPLICFELVEGAEDVQYYMQDKSWGVKFITPCVTDGEMQRHEDPSTAVINVQSKTDAIDSIRYILNEVKDAINAYRKRETAVQYARSKVKNVLTEEERKLLNLHF
jgi:hypothetical protein